MWNIPVLLSDHPVWASLPKIFLWSCFIPTISFCCVLSMAAGVSGLFSDSWTFPAGLLQELLPLAQGSAITWAGGAQLSPNLSPWIISQLIQQGWVKGFIFFITSSWKNKKFKVQFIQHTFRAVPVVFQNEKDPLISVSSLLCILNSNSSIIQGFCSLLSAPFEGSDPSQLHESMLPKAEPVFKGTQEIV